MNMYFVCSKFRFQLQKTSSNPTSCLHVISTIPYSQVASVPDSIPASSKRGLLKALVLLGSAQEDKATREAYWGQVFTPCCENF